MVVNYLFCTYLCTPGCVFFSFVDPRNFAYSFVFRVMVDDFCLHLVQLLVCVD